MPSGSLLAFPEMGRGAPLPRKPELEEHFVVEGPGPDGDRVGPPLDPPGGGGPGSADWFRLQGGGSRACPQAVGEIGPPRPAAGPAPLWPTEAPPRLPVRSGHLLRGAGLGGAPARVVRGSRRRSGLRPVGPRNFVNEGPPLFDDDLHGRAFDPKQDSGITGVGRLRSRVAGREGRRARGDQDECEAMVVRHRQTPRGWGIARYRS